LLFAVLCFLLLVRVFPALAVVARALLLFFFQRRRSLLLGARLDERGHRALRPGRPRYLMRAARKAWLRSWSADRARAIRTGAGVASGRGFSGGFSLSKLRFSTSFRDIQRFIFSESLTAFVFVYFRFLFMAFSMYRLSGRGSRELPHGYWGSRCCVRLFSADAGGSRHLAAGELRSQLGSGWILRRYFFSGSE
jgi:hypothetical protein